MRAASICCARHRDVDGRLVGALLAVDPAARARARAAGSATGSTTSSDDPPEFSPSPGGTRSRDARAAHTRRTPPPSRSRRCYGDQAVRGSRVLTVVLLGASPLAGVLAS